MIAAIPFIQKLRLLLAMLACLLSAPALAAFTDNGNGTVSDTATGLMWQRCAKGQTWTGSTCSGSGTTYGWDAAAALTDSYAGQTDWRCPSQTELQSLVKPGSRPTIDTTAFPNTPVSFFWSGSSFVPNPTDAWGVNFYYGSTHTSGKTDGSYSYVRLVRGGQSLGSFALQEQATKDQTRKDQTRNEQRKAAAEILTAPQTSINPQSAVLERGRLNGILYSGDKYEGDVLNGEPDGFGIMTTTFGEHYEGYFKNGTYHGKGVRLISSGERSEGEFIEGYLEGIGKLTSKDGSRYEGAFSKGKPHGKGKVFRADGSVGYEGDVRFGTMHGKGKKVLSSVGFSYEGDFYYNKMSGYGIQTTSEGERYEGEFDDGKKSGLGVETFPNGRRYEGRFRDDQYDGKGKLIKSNGDHYEGWFTKNAIDGTGSYSNAKGDRYEGEFKDGRFHGKGKYIFAGGDRIEGNVINDTFNGSGIYYFASGARYEGNFKNDKFHGNGIWFYPNGERFEGEWQDGTLVSSSSRGSNGQSLQDWIKENKGLTALIVGATAIYGMAEHCKAKGGCLQSSSSSSTDSSSGSSSSSSSSSTSKGSVGCNYKITKDPYDSSIVSKRVKLEAEIRCMGGEYNDKSYTMITDGEGKWRAFKIMPFASDKFEASMHNAALRACRCIN